MIVVFQRPIADLRWLVTDKKGLSPPIIPGTTRSDGPGEGAKHKVNIDSLRHFGWADKRPAGAGIVFPDEYCFYSAHNAVQFFKVLGKKVFENPDTKFQKEVRLIRRLFISSTHFISTRVEFSLTIHAESPPLKQTQLIQLLETFIVLPTKIPSITPKNNEGKESDYIPLLYQGQALAEHYALATSQWSVDDHRLKAKLVRSCRRPALLVEFGHSEIIPSEITASNNSPHFTRLDNSHTNGADLWYGTLSRGTVPCWLMAPGTGKPDNLRSLRLCILRLHAEIEILDEVLRWLSKDPRSIDIKRLTSYFKYIDTKIFNRDNRANFVQPKIVRAILELMGSHSDMVGDIRERFENACNEFKDKNPSEENSGDPTLDVTWKDWIKKVKPQPSLTVVIQNLPDPSYLSWSFYSGGNAVEVPDPVVCKAGGQRDLALKVIATLNQQGTISGATKSYRSYDATCSFLHTRIFGPGFLILTSNADKNKQCTNDYEYAFFINWLVVHHAVMA